jgi:transposase-like protein
MALLSAATVLRLVDSMAVLLSQAYRLARARLASTGSPILHLLVQRDQEATEVNLLRREVEVLPGQRASLPPHRRPDYRPAQRLAILQLRQLRGRSIKKTAEHFVLHRNTIRAWIRAAEGKGRPGLLNGAVVWNRIDDAVRWTVHELRRLCPEPEFGTRAIARQVLRQLPPAVTSTPRLGRLRRGLRLRRLGLDRPIDQLLKQRQLVRIDPLAAPAVQPAEKLPQPVLQLPNATVLVAQHVHQLPDHLLENAYVLRKCGGFDVHVTHL